MTDGGYGFVQTPEGEFFIPRSALGDAFDGDYVEVRPTRRRNGGGGGGQSGHRSLVGRVCSVIVRAHSTLVGRYEVAEPFGVVVPLDPRMNHDIFTRRSDNPDIADGSIVRVRLTAYPTRSSAACGVIEEVLDGIGDLDCEIVFERHHLPRTFSDEATAEADELRLDVDGALAAGYRDLRDRRFVTIDPADARDFDDAIAMEPTDDGGWRLFVAIADVSAYVTAGSALDREARQRGCSVYLADRAVPMLPERLSCDLCSLQPDHDRLALVVELYFDETLRRRGQEVYAAVIRSRAAFSYDRVLELLEGAVPDADEMAFTELFFAASRVASALEEQRRLRGGLEFTTVEPKARFNEEGAVIAIDLRRKTAATALVESAMIEANEAVARWIEGVGDPMLYRIHEKPDAGDLAGLIPVFDDFPWFDTALASRLAAGEPKAIQEILDRSAGRAEETLVNALLLRCQQRARYAPENLGHFGLGAPVYTHFTSPIRRYPDLIVHRRVKALLGFAPSPGIEEGEALSAIADHSSTTERAAEEASRMSQEQKMVRFMADRVGETFEGVIAGVATYGIYVRLDEGPEGLVRSSTLPDGPYTYRPGEHKLVGFKERRTLRLGGRVRVVLREADLTHYRLTFELR